MLPLGIWIGFDADGLPLFGKGERGKDGFPADKAGNADKEDAEEDADAVDRDISCRRSSANDKRLVVFIQSGEGNAEDSGKQHQSDPADAVHIERKGYGNCQNEIFGNMSEFSHVIVYLVCIDQNLVCSQIFIQNAVCHLYDPDADPVADSGRGYAVLCGKRKDHIHNDKRRKERERL